MSEQTDKPRSRPLSPFDPPEVIEGFLRGMDRFGDELAARQRAMGRPEGRTMWRPEDVEGVRRALLRHATRAFRGGRRSRSA